MKILFCLLALAASLPAFAAEKKCTFAGGDDQDQGSSFTVNVTETSITVSNLTAGSSAWEGKFTRGMKDSVVNGRDGKIYLDFTGGTSGDDGCSEVLADENLVKPTGKGNVKFRCRGEGFMNDVYACRPN
jgi:hypothetical protein